MIDIPSHPEIPGRLYGVPDGEVPIISTTPAQILSLLMNATSANSISLGELDLSSIPSIFNDLFQIWREEGEMVTIYGGSSHASYRIVAMINWQSIDFTSFANLGYLQTGLFTSLYGEAMG